MVGGFEPEGLGVKTQPSRFLCGSIAKLKAEFDDILLLAVTGEKQVRIADGMKCPRPSEGRSDFVSRDGFFDVVYHDERSFCFITQAQKCLAQGGHRPGIVFILVVGGVEGVQDDDLSFGLFCSVKEVFESFCGGKEVSLGTGIDEKPVIGGNSERLPHGIESSDELFGWELELAK